MKLTHDGKVLYDFFCQIAVVDNSVDYPLILLNAWANGETSSVVAEYGKKDEVLTAYNHCIVQGSLDKPLFLAIKQIKGW